MHYYTFHPKDYISKTHFLDHMEDLAYRRMLDYIYLNECHLPEDLDELAKKINMRTHSGSIASVLREFFTLTDDGYMNDRAEQEIAKYQEKSHKASESAKARWNKKAAKPIKVKDSCERIANEKRTHSEGNANHKPLTINQEPLTNNQLKALSDKSDCVNEIFGYWVSVMNKNSLTKLTPKRKTCVQARLKEGYTVEQIKHAIDGCAKSPHHMGQNDAGTIYDDLTLICRSGDRLEQFANNVAQVVPTTNNFNQHKKPYTGLAADDISWVAGMEDLY